MKMLQPILAALVLSLSTTLCAFGDPIPIKDFARVPEISGVSISPDGRYLGLIRPFNGIPSWVTLDKTASYKPHIALGGDPERKYRLMKCTWASSVRSICFFRTTTQMMGNLTAASTMTALNADGSEVTYLKPSGFAGSSMFNDGVLDVNASPDTVLVSMFDAGNFYPSVLELNTKTNKTRVRDAGRQSINSYYSDSKGNLRFASGFAPGQSISYFARAVEGGSWKGLDKLKASAKNMGFLRPIAVSSKLNVAYIIAAAEGRNALWSADLADKNEPTVVFSHPSGNVTEPLIASDGSLLGVIYQTDRPFVFYVDAVVEDVMDTAKRMLPSGQFNFPVDRSANEQYFVIGSSNMIDGVSYFLFDRKAGKLGNIGSDYPELKARSQELGRKQRVRLAARDGVEITAQLTLPLSLRAENLPLIVLRSSDVFGREPWRLEFLQQYLANRGFAVLEPSVRMASGTEFNRAAIETTFSNDLIDATKHLISKGMVDAKRACIAGWNMGGLNAYLEGAKNPDLFKCVISVAGVSDAESLRGPGLMGPMAAPQGPSDQSRTKMDSGIKVAKDITVPVLMLHGTLDTTVKVDQSRRMDKALSGADKAHKYIEIEGGDHEFSREADRLKLLTEIDTFLSQHVGSAQK